MPGLDEVPCATDSAVVVGWVETAVTARFGASLLLVVGPDDFPVVSAGTTFSPGTALAPVVITASGVFPMVAAGTRDNTICPVQDSSDVVEKYAAEFMVGFGSLATPRNIKMIL
jgi:hypothetical protein